MSRASVRSAVQAWFAPPAIPMLNQVYRSMPKDSDGKDMKLSANNGSGAIAFVHIEHESEHRIAIGGATNGWKRTAFDIGLVVRFRSVKTLAEDAMDDYDAMIDNIKSRLRSDHQIGQQSGIVFSAGEEDRGITITSDMPVLVNREVQIWSVVQFTVVEMVQA